MASPTSGAWYSTPGLGQLCLVLMHCGLRMLIAVLGIQAIYCIYSTAMVAIIMCQVPNYSDIRELAGLQFPISTLVSHVLQALKYSYSKIPCRSCWRSLLPHCEAVHMNGTGSSQLWLQQGCAICPDAA